jgi:lysophospholipase L1-like esterase
LNQQSNELPPDQNGERPSLSRGRKLLFMSILVAIGLFLAELTLQVLMVDVEIRLHPKEGGLIQPYQKLASADLVAEEFRVPYEINEHGYRDKRGRLMQKSTRKSVLFLGDSFTEGYGVEFEKTYVQQLSKQFSGIEFWNCARMGASPLYYVFTLRELGPKLAPDLVVVQLFDNDLNENSFRRVKARKDGRLGPLPKELRPEANGPGLFPKPALYKAWKRLRRRMKGRSLPRIFIRRGSYVSPKSLIFKESTSASRTCDFYDKSKLGDWQERFSTQERLLTQLIEEYRQMKPKGRMIILYVPHVQVYSKAAHSALALRKVNPHSQRVAAVCERLNVSYVDSSEFFIGPGEKPESFYYSKDLHWNAKGHSRTAVRLGPRIKAELKRP